MSLIEYYSILDMLKNLKRSDKYAALSTLSEYYTWESIKESYKNNKFKISAPTWNESFHLPDRSYSAPNVKDYFKYILKKPQRKANDPSI